MKMGWIKNRIDSEYKKHKKLDWSKIAEAKINSNILELIDKEIIDFKKDKSMVEEKYRNVELTKENQELRIDATLSTLKSIKVLITGDKRK